MVGSFENVATLADLETNAESIGMIYATTVGRNPAGTIMAPRNAERLAHIAARHDLVTIDDRALEWCGFSPDMPAPLAAYAPDAPILTLGSLDKTTGAGMRVGWIRAPRRFAHRLARLKALSDIASPTHVQRVAVRLVERLGDIGEARRAVLRGRYEVLAGLLRRAFPTWRWVEPDGGLSIWVDTGLPGARLVAAAAEAGVKLIAGAAFVPDSPDDTHLRIAFSQPEAALRRGVERLATIAGERKLVYF
jgi:DNA-binding transcriptional MocR family regulator